MRTLFKVDISSGSLKDKISGVVGTNLNGEMQQLEKGWAVNTDDAVTSILSYPALNVNLGTNDFYYAAYVKLRESTGDFQGIFGCGYLAFDIGFGFIVSEEGFFISQIRDEGTVSNITTSESYTDNQWHLLVASRINDTHYFYIDNELIGTGDVSDISINLIKIIALCNSSNISSRFTLNGSVMNPLIVEGTLTSTIRNQLYEEFLHTFPLAKQKVRPIDYSVNKPKNLNEEGLVAAYNMINEEGEIEDISGNGNTGTLEGNPVSRREGMYFGFDDYLDLDDNIEINGASGFTYLMRLDGSNFDNIYNNIFYNEDHIDEYHLSLRRVDGYIRTPSNANILNFSPDLPTSMFTFALVYNPSTELLKIYIDGVEVYSTTYAFLSENFEIESIFKDSSSGSINAYEGVAEDLKIYNRTLSEQEIKDYHNQFANRINLVEDFAYEPADGNNIIPKEWIPGTGSYKVIENSGLDGESKALECTSDGIISIPSRQAYGTWEFETYANDAANLFIINDSLTGGNFYQFRAFSDGVIGIYRTGGNVVMFTPPSYIEAETWYGVKITRNFQNKFTLYIKGGNFGDDYILVDVSGGSGTNPATDNTFTSSNYLNCQYCTGDRIANIKITDAVAE